MESLGFLRPDGVEPDWIPAAAPVKAQKMVDAADAHFLEQGCLKIGRLEDYAQIENGRADASDGAVMYAARNLDSSVPGHRDVIEGLGVVSAGFGGQVTITNSLVQHHSPPTYAFCMAMDGCDHDPSPEKPKAVFSISDVQRLSALLTYEHGARFQSCMLSEVAYEPRYLEAEARGDSRPSPFIKDVRFAAEQEIRLAFSARPHAPYETIYTAPNKFIASLFKRIG